MKEKILVLLVLGFGFLSCAEKQAEEVLDVPYTVEQLNDPKTGFSSEDVAKLKTIAHRFYSHVDVRNGLYVLSVKDSKELGISDKLFVAMRDNLEEINAFLKESRKNGLSPEVPELTPGILTSMISE